MQYRKDWDLKGIRYLRDIFEYTGIMKDMTTLKQEYNIQMNFIEYLQLYNAIPGNWKEAMRSHYISAIGPVITDTSQFLISQKKGCRKYYKTLCKDLTLPVSNAMQKWETDLECEIDAEEIPKVYTLIAKATKDVNLRYLQFKLLHRICPCNKFLTKINILNNELCDICENEVEDLLHIFWRCESINALWNDIFKWMETCGYPERLPDPKTVIMGDHKMDMAFNLIIIVAKKVIFRNKYKKIKTKLIEVKAAIKDLMSVEEYVASTDMKRDKFLGKWATVYHLL